MKQVGGATPRVIPLREREIRMHWDNLLLTPTLPFLNVFLSSCLVDRVGSAWEAH